MFNTAKLLKILTIFVYICLIIQVTESNISANGNVIKDKRKSQNSGLHLSKGDKSIEGSGFGPENEILSDDEDDLPGLLKPSSDKKKVDFDSDIDLSGDGPLEPHPPHGANFGHNIPITSHSSDPISVTEEGDEDAEDDDDDDDEDDDEGSGGSFYPSKGKGDFAFSTKETITDDDNFKFPINKQPDSSNIHPELSEDKDIIVDNIDRSPENFFPDDSETSTRLHTSVHNRDRDRDADGNTLRNDISILGRKQDARPVSFFAQPSMLAAVIGGTVVSLLCAILLAMFIIYRTRKKDEGSYICEPSLTSPVMSPYGKGSSNKFYDP